MKLCLVRDSTILVAGLVLASMLGTTARADIRIDERYTVDALGGMSVAAVEGRNSTMIAGQKARTNSTLKFKSKMMRMLARGDNESAEVIRLDEEKIYNIDVGEKKYTEMTFAEMRAQMQAVAEQVESAMTEVEKSGAPGTGAALPVDDESCEWDEPRVESRRTGERSTIAGLDSEQAVISVKSTCRDRKTGNACEMTWYMEQWLANDQVGGDELTEFWKAYAGKLGLTEVFGPAVRGQATHMADRFGSGWGEITKHSAEFKGLPTRTIMQLDIGGPDCKTADGTQISQDAAFADAAQAGLEAGTATAASVAAQETARTAAGSVGGGIAGAIAGSAAAAAASKMVSGMFSKKKKQEPPPPAPDQTTPPGGSVRIFRFFSETTSVSQDAVPADQFEVPAGFTKVAAPKIGQ